MYRCVALISDDDDLRRGHLTAALATVGCATSHSAPLLEVPEHAARIRPDIILIAFDAPHANDALRVVDRVHGADRRLPVLFLSSDVREATLVGAIRAGVKDYWREPLDLDALAGSARRCLAAARSRGAAPAPHSAPGGRGRTFIGHSRTMRSIDEYLDRVAQHDATVLITGETGTGKELAATRIHNQSPRRASRFVSVNCAAIPDGLLESELFGYESGAFTGAGRTREGLLQLANGGTVFLDEVGDLGSVAQAKILRAIESREIYRLGGKRPEKLDVRIVAATNQDLERAVDDGRFRKDLYFRLNVARIHLPPLRERRSDILPLLEHYLKTLDGHRPLKVDAFSAETIAALQAYDWPGNVRELKNLVEAILVFPPPDVVALRDLPDDFRRRLQRVSSLPDAERRRLVEALLTAKWNKSKAASLLQCSRMTLYRKMTKYSLVGSVGSVGSEDACANLSRRLVTPPRRKTPE